MPDDPADERRKATKDALEKCSETVNRAMVSLLAVSLFCLLTTLGAADRSLVAPEATIKIPFADAPISFVGFLVVAPLLLVVLTIYLHVFYGSWQELETERRAQGLPETYPTLFSVDRRIARLLTALVFYWLTPVVAAIITWKAAARFAWGLPVALVTVLLTTGLVYLQLLRGGPASPPSKRRAWSLGVLGLLMAVAMAIALVNYLDLLFDMDLRPAAYWERPLNLLRADLKGAWLVQGRFRGAEISYANLERADLRVADLGGASLIGANLAEADLSGAVLEGADLRMANLGGANLLAARASKADLGEAKLEGAKLNLATLSAAKLNMAKLGKADLTGANLTGADLNLANLSGANLFAADLSGANLGMADATHANLTRANLSKADLDQTNLTEANLSAANLIGTNLTQAILWQTDLRGAALVRARLTKANLTQADFREANLSGADLHEAMLFRTNLGGAILQDADFSQADLSEVLGLTCDQIRTAKTDKATMLPAALKCAKK